MALNKIPRIREEIDCGREDLDTYREDIAEAGNSGREDIEEAGAGNSSKEDMEEAGAVVEDASSTGAVDKTQVWVIMSVAFCFSSALQFAVTAKKEFYSTIDVLQIFRQLCAGLKHMHSFEPPYAHNGVKPDNILITHRKGQSPLAILMDFVSARHAMKQIHSRSEAAQLQE